MAVSAGYKQTEVGVIPEDWEVVPIGSLASFTSGNGISVAALQQQSPHTPVPVYGGNGIAGYTNMPIVQRPVVVVGRVGQKCGEVYLTDGPAWITDNALYPRSIFRAIDIRFFALAMQAARLNDVKNRNDLPLVTQSILHAVRIPLPPTLAEQQAIAEALRDVDGLISGVDALIAKKRLIKQGAMQELLTGQRRLPGFAGAWEVKELVNISTISSGTTPSRDLGERYYSNGTINWVKTTDLNNSNIVETSEKVTEIAIKETNLKIYDVGTVLVAMYGGFNQIGRTGLLKIPAAVNQALTAIRPESKALDSVFLINYLNFQVGYWKNVAMSSRKDPNITSADIKNFPIALPSLSEQTAIAQILADMDAEIAALGQKRAKTVALKQGMMQSLLTGAVRLG